MAWAVLSAVCRCLLAETFAFVLVFTTAFDGSFSCAVALKDDELLLLLELA